MQDVILAAMRGTGTTILTRSQLVGSKTSRFINSSLDQYVLLQVVC